MYRYSSLCFLYCSMPLSELEAVLKPLWSSWILKNKLIVHDAPNGADPGTPAAPLAEPLVLSGPNQVHPSPVVRVLIEEPVAVGYVAGEDVVYVETVHDAGAVVHQVHHLTSKLDPLIQTHFEWPRLLIYGWEALIHKLNKLHMYWIHHIIRVLYRWLAGWLNTFQMQIIKTLLMTLMHMINFFNNIFYLMYYLHCGSWW